MRVLRRVALWAGIVVVTALTACAARVEMPPAVHESTADRLRIRAELAAKHFIAGDFDKFQTLGSVRYRREINSLPSEDQRKGQIGRASCRERV